VVDLKLEFDPKKMTFDIPVIIVIEPGRIYVKAAEKQTGEGRTTTGEAHTIMEQLVEKGLRPAGPAAFVTGSSLWPWTIPGAAG
jgi:hypothetical protein